jgi:capsular polysaccharide biosynthesis protein
MLQGARRFGGKGLLGRAGNRAARLVVERCGVPPSYVGYRHLRSETPKGYAERARTSPAGPPYAFQCIEGERMVGGALPGNVPSRHLLSRAKGIHENVQRWPLSFYDVAGRRASETFVATISDCRIVTRADKNGHDLCAIINKDERLLNVRGTGFDEGHARVLRSVKDVKRLTRAAWVLEHWYQNYHHWLAYHLPKIVLLDELGLAAQIVLPDDLRRTPVIEQSIRSLGLEPVRLQKLDAPVMSVAELTVVGMDYYHKALLQKVRDKIAGPAVESPSRRILISRLGAGRRRLENEEEVWTVLENFGFERVLMEDLSFERQVELMKETSVIVGLHGAGLANMIFAPKGTHILEISDRAFPAPDHYALASALDHHYWLAYGSTPTGSHDPGYDDVVADPAEIKEIVSRIEARLAAGPAEER